ncbi:trypsin-like peptidase domain-containing protein [Streptomyces sp. V4-01]|uniref:Trypsin-like peptidase domain-containing protein n=1 Tax=Actinacidiphila polyblastidii TaxID=3110430 RepID=A0ABU7PIZ1_9ACTN|nr:trypsin-like peptidase domain-containing protein [Streptomyces sp. V4-01]
MTESSSRNGGESPYPQDPQQPPASFGAPTPPPAAPHSAPHSDPHGSTAYGSSPWQVPQTAPGFPPPPFGPAHPAAAHPAAPEPGPAQHGRRRVRRPLALVAAAAVAAGVIGGGAGALISNATDGGGTVAATSTSSRAVNAAAVDGTVASVVKAVDPSVVEINATSSQGKATGSGIIITANGQIVTNNHVIAGADSISVTYTNGRTATASLVGADPKKDLALIKVQGASGLPAATLGDSGTVAVGDQVVAIGSPEGLSNTVTSGIVSALNRDVTVPVEDSQGQSQDQSGGGSSDGSGNGGNDGRWPFSFGGNQYNGSTGTSTTTYKAIQTDASLNPGNSGGALINMSGQIVGINAAMYSASSDSSSDSSSAGSVGLGFAIPINTVKADLATLQGGGTSD